MTQAIALLAAVALVIGGLAGSAALDERAQEAPQGERGEGGGGAGQADEASLEQFCEASRRLNAAQAAFLAGFEQRPEASPADFEEAQREFVRQNQSLLDLVRRTAPDSIVADVEVVVEAAGAAPNDPEARASFERLTAFVEANC